MATSKFRTTELSNPEFEMDGLRFITVKSSHLKGRGDICVFVPEGEYRDLPMVTLLHGVWGSCWVWPMMGNAHGVANNLINSGQIKPMILAMPSDGLWGDGSAYMPHGEQDFEKWIAEDVPQAVLENIPQVSKTSKHFISGLSMGGYGALKIGARYGEQYAGISAHSSITAFDQMQLFVEESEEHYRSSNKELEDAFTSIINNRAKLPPLRIDCGESDLLIEYNRTLHQRLNEEEIDHVYQEFPGGHEWAYWQEHLVDTLEFFNNYC
ncbi:MAG: alpha/beta hydrolase-fold protein [Bacteroidota bacterium]